ncbi:MAG: DUF1634 domain-containing protein [Candidatus Thermoplasmatota archaeon]|nr:DUF1634 domain-containing protein [Candidatus Thermoplasmatota archaeon]
MPSKQRDIDSITSLILRVGVLSSLSLIIVGVILLFIRGSADGVSISQIASFHSTFNSSYLNPTHIVQGLIAVDPLYFITLGLWVLIFTPITVVFTSMVTFITAGNRLYIAMSLIVLFNLFFAMLAIPSLIHT